MNDEEQALWRSVCAAHHARLTEKNHGVGFSAVEVLKLAGREADLVIEALRVVRQENQTFGFAIR